MLLTYQEPSEGADIGQGESGLNLP